MSKLHFSAANNTSMNKQTIIGITQGDDFKNSQTH